MNLLQRYRSQRSISVDSMLGGLDTSSLIASLYRLNGRPYNGQYEVNGDSLDQIAERVLKSSGPVFSLIALRMAVFSEARLQFQRLSKGRPAGLFGDRSLDPLEHPFGPSSTTGDLLARMLLDVDLMGNSYTTDRTLDSDGIVVAGTRLRRLRPDWVTLVYGSEAEPDLYGDALDGELIAYLYTPRLPGGGLAGEGTVLLPDEVAHFAPYPDPQAFHRGMSWLTPVLREVQADEAALIHKDAFFRNGASPRLAMKIDPSIQKEDFDRLAEMIDAAHTGPANAYKTLYLGGGADPVPMTFNMRDLDYKSVIGGGETRLAAAAGVPATIVGFSEGLAGSSLNAGNYQQSKRRLGDITMRPLWRNAAGSLETLFPPPDSGSRLWYDDRDIAFLRDDETDAATITQTRASTVLTLVNAGYTPESAAAAAATGDLSGLQHTGLFSVQLQPPGAGEMTPDGKAAPVAVEPDADDGADTSTDDPATPENGPTP